MPHGRSTRGIAPQVTFAAAIAGLGVLGLATGHFASVWQPVPRSFPGREALAYVNGILMCALGMGLLLKRTRARASLVLTLYLASWLLLHVPIVVRSPTIENNWAGLAENSTLVTGALALFASSADASCVRLRALAGVSGIRLARIIFVLALPLMSLDELLYARATASYIPGWIPAHLFFACFTGAAQMATAGAVGFGFLPRLATMLQAAMFAAFTLIVWGTRILQGPTRITVTAFLISSALTGATGLIAQTYRDSAWIALPVLARRPAARKLSTAEEDSSAR